LDSGGEGSSIDSHQVILKGLGYAVSIDHFGFSKLPSFSLPSHPSRTGNTMSDIDSKEKTLDHTTAAVYPVSDPEDDAATDDAAVAAKVQDSHR
jgi:hypothetical protein